MILLLSFYGLISWSFARWTVKKAPTWITAILFNCIMIPIYLFSGVIVGAWLGDLYNWSTESSLRMGVQASLISLILSPWASVKSLSDAPREKRDEILQYVKILLPNLRVPVCLILLFLGLYVLLEGIPFTPIERMEGPNSALVAIGVVMVIAAVIAFVRWPNNGRDG